MQENRLSSREIQAALEAGWIQMQEIKSLFLAQLLQQILDKGEAEAIALAHDLQTH